MPTESTNDKGIDDAAIRRMAAFAVTTVDWSSQRRSYLDNFINYALAVLPTNSTTAFPRESVRPLIIEKFNLTLPPAIVQQLLRRAVRLGYLASVGDHAITLTAKGRREVSPIPYTLNKLEQEQRKLAQRFAEWASETLAIDIDSARATSMLLDYVETYYCSLMALAETADAEKRLPKVEPSPDQKVTAAFIASINSSDEELFESVANLARGSMMVSALYAPTLVDTTRGFQHTTIYLDTKIVLRALGYEGEPAEQATVDLLSILKRQHARVAVFEFTLREIQSVLEAVAQRARGGRIWSARPGSVESYFYRLNASNAQIEQHAVRVESRMTNLGISVDPSPAYDSHRFVIDESSVEALLTQGNPNYRPSALKHDVELIAAMVRARAGRARGSLEESRATFMTLNSLVVNTARVAEREYREPWPLAMFENDIAALTWVKEPLAAPNLPKHQLFATSLGLTNPGRHDWELYISEIVRLVESDEITDNDLILLRQKYERDTLAFVGAPRETSDNDRRMAVRASIDEAREAVAQELTEPYRSENAHLASSLSLKEEAFEALRHEADELRDASDEQKRESERLLRALLRSAWLQGRVIEWCVRGTLLLVAAAAIAVTFTPGAETWLGHLVGGVWLIWGVRAIAVVAAVLGGLWGPIAKLGQSARARFLVHRLRRLGIEPDRASELGFPIIST